MRRSNRHRPRRRLGRATSRPRVDADGRRARSIDHDEKDDNEASSEVLLPLLIATAGQFSRAGTQRDVPLPAGSERVEGRKNRSDSSRLPTLRARSEANAESIQARAVPKTRRSLPTPALSTTLQTAGALAPRLLPQAGAHRSGRNRRSGRSLPSKLAVVPFTSRTAASKRTRAGAVPLGC